jgi:hypothetical protein
MTRPPLEIHIHLSDGQAVRFAVDEPGQAQYVIDKIVPERLFQQPHIQICREHALSMYPTSHVVRVDFIMTEDPDWPFVRPLLDCVEVTGNEVIERFKPESYLCLMREGVQTEQEIETFAEIRAPHNKGVYVLNRVLLTPAIPVDRTLLLHQPEGAPVLHVRRRTGGAILFNPMHVIGVTLYPGPKDILSAWPGRYASA